MAVNLINSNDIEVEQTGQDIQLKTSTPISTIEGNIGDLTLLTTTDKSSVVNAVNEVNGATKRKIASATLSSNTSFSNNNNINFDSFSSTTPNITYSNGVITIGNNISKIMISGNMSINYGAATSKTYGFDLRKDGTTFTGTRCQKSLGQPIGCSVPNYLLDVTQGNIITMTFATDSSSTTINGGTYLTIEVIE